MTPMRPHLLVVLVLAVAAFFGVYAAGRTGGGEATTAPKESSRAVSHSGARISFGSDPRLPTLLAQPAATPTAATPAPPAAPADPTPAAPSPSPPAPAGPPAPAPSPPPDSTPETDPQPGGAKPFSDVE